MKTDSPCGCEMPTLKISWEWCHVWVPRSPATSHHSQGTSQFTTVSRVSGDTPDHSYSTLRVLEAGNASTCPFIPRAVPGTEQKLTKNLLNVDCMGNPFRPLLLRDKSNMVSVFTGFHQAFTLWNWVSGEIIWLWHIWVHTYTKSLVYTHTFSFRRQDGQYFQPRIQRIGCNQPADVRSWVCSLKLWTHVFLRADGPPGTQLGRPSRGRGMEGGV